MSQQVVVFDVNETLLDLAGLDEPFRKVFGTADAKSQWFAQTLALAMTSVIVDRYHDFSAQGRAALKLVAAQRGVTLEEGQITQIVERMKHLPAHTDAGPALERLKEAGIRMATLTNSPPSVAEAQLRNAGLDAYFETTMSVDAIKRFKPTPETYRMAASRLGVEPAGIRMVAAHHWDIEGAMAADCRGAFLSRGGQLFNPLAPQPDIIESTLEAVAEAIIQRPFKE